MILEDLEGFRWSLKDFHQFWKVFDCQTALDRSQTLRNVEEHCQTPCAQQGSNLQASRMHFWSSRTRFLHLRKANPDPIPIYSVYYCRTGPAGHRGGEAARSPYPPSPEKKMKIFKIFRKCFLKWSRFDHPPLSSPSCAFPGSISE